MLIMYSCLKELKKLRHEKAYCFDKSNNLIFTKSSELNPDKVDFNNEEIEFLRNKCFTLVHNHPEDTPFSLQDIYFAIQCNIENMIVISPIHIYTLKLNLKSVHQEILRCDLLDIAKELKHIYINSHETFITLSNEVSYFKYSRVVI